jgi:hypothetical protein
LAARYYLFWKDVAQTMQSCDNPFTILAYCQYVTEWFGTMSMCFGTTQLTTCSYTKKSSIAALQSMDTTIGQKSPFLLEMLMHYDLQHCDITIQEYLFVKEGHKNVH